MELLIEIVTYIIAAILIGIIGAWIYLIKSMIESFTKTPYLDKFENTNNLTPKVSIILPARNEEKYLAKCLDSLIEQDYENYEIVVIDDSSEDTTGKIIAEYAEKNSKIIHVSANSKPEGWMGKNWACMEGYRHAKGELLLFTDADTKHSNQVISLAVSHLLSLQLDALSAIPRLLTFDFLTKVSLPMISTFLHTRFSAINVNNPKKKAAYFFGSFFIITKKTYQKVGMHEGVKHEIVEDGALIKNAKKYDKKAEIKGVLIVEMVKGGKELIIGSKLEPGFGPVIMLGMGGIYVEVLKDVTFKLAPVTDKESDDMIASIKTQKLLQGVRGEKPSDIAKLSECIQRLSQLVSDFKEIKELDMNPVLVMEKGKGCKILDVRIGL